MYMGDIENTTTSGLSPGAKEFVPGVPRTSAPKPKLSQNRSAPVFVSRVFPGMIPDQEVAYPDVSEPVFFPPRIQEFDDFLPFDDTKWSAFSSPKKRERIVPPNKFKFKVLSEVPPPEEWNKSFPVDLLLAMRSFYIKPTDDIEGFLQHQDA